MKFNPVSHAITLLFLLLSLDVGAQKSVSLPRSTPEAVGVSSQAIINFLEAVSTSKHEFHSFMFLRHGKVIAEGWWDPYKPELKQTLYSTSKSFTATAIGFAISEKRLIVNDKVISFFPGELPDSISPFLAELKIKDLLTMSVGQDPDPSFNIVATDNWMKAFLALPMVNKPGTKFLYNSMATYMLSAIIQKVTGQKEIEYLTPRLFEPLGIQGMDWEVDPRGINTGGWGLRLKTEDLVKFGLLFLQKGMWKGKQIIPATWIEEASSLKIIQNPNITQSRRDSSDWEQGYCYQMWRCRHNAFRGDGAYGQFMIVMPDQDAVIAITAEAFDLQDEISLVWKYLLPAMNPGKLAENTNMQVNLRQKLSSLALPLPAGSNLIADANQIPDKTYVMEPNKRNIKTMKIKFKDKTGYLTMKTDTADYSFSFGSGSWKTGETFMAGPTLFSMSKALFAGLPAFKVAGSYVWKDQNTLEMVLRYVESPHHVTFVCHFEKKEILAEILNSPDPESKKTILRGECIQ